MNISKETEAYVLEHASIKDSLKKSLINYSKLSRKIISEKSLNKKNFDAIVVALRRLERRLKSKASFENSIRELLKSTSVEIRNKMLVCIIEKDIFYQNLLHLQKEIRDFRGSANVVEGSNAITLITSQEFEQTIDKYFKNSIIKKKKNVASITLKSPESLEHTPGVVGYIYSLFGEHGINIIETLSCWRDTILIVEEKDVKESLKFLNFDNIK